MNASNKLSREIRERFFAQAELDRRLKWRESSSTRPEVSTGLSRADPHRGGSRPTRRRISSGREIEGGEASPPKEAESAEADRHRWNEVRRRIANSLGACRLRGRHGKRTTRKV
ncbi:MAG: hypothetical protein KIT73_03200 [Burkholderiales bacterium]|nr:hypothetical protein [Burkholderiales bacterium]